MIVFRILTCSALMGLMALSSLGQSLETPTADVLPVRLDTTLIETGTNQSSPEVKIARLNGDRVNLRARPSLVGVVIGQTHLNQVVEVLEILDTGATNAVPTRWAKIRLPEDIPVWIHGDYVDPISRKVSASRLNLRAGPGEAYGILGRVESGTPVEVLEEKEGWLKIGAPEGAYAFLAASFLDMEGAAEVAAPMVDPIPVVSTLPPIQTITNAVPVPNEVIVNLDPIEPEPPLNVPTPEMVIPIEVLAENVVDLSMPAEPAQPALELPVDLNLPTAELAPPLPPLNLEDGEARRVIREGIVVRTWSPKSPTHFALEDTRTGRVIHFLYPADTGLDLKPYKGRRIRVTGPELMDKRWSRTSMIRIETLELLD